MSNNLASLILVADDYKPHRDLMTQTLKSQGYRTAIASDGFEAMQWIAKARPDLVLLDVSMPQMNGIEVLKQLRANPQTGLLPVILVTAQSESEDKVSGYDAGASDFLSKPWAVPELLSRVKAHLRVKLLTDELENVEQVLFMLAKVVEFRDAYTLDHTERVARYALAIGRDMRITPEEKASLSKGAMLHDIGKIGIPDAILRKSGPLSQEEFAQMRQHPNIGIEITRSLHSLGNAAHIIRHHHERWDGKGYPSRLTGENIPRLARIVAVTDAFDAMTSDRPYHKGKSWQEGLEILHQGAGSAWDARVVASALRVLPEFHKRTALQQGPRSSMIH
jgi:putative two-component system response regulator